MAVSFVNGKFDILTPAHFALLNHARRFAGLDGTVVVTIDSDKRIAKNDPLMPIFPQGIRKKHLEMLRCLDTPLVNAVTTFDTDDELYYIIKGLKPDYMIKGTDWANKPVIGSDLVQMVWYPVEKDGLSDKVSSTDVIKIILKRYENKNHH